MRARFDPTLCLVVGHADCAGRPIEEVVLAAVAGGVTMVQLREKTASDDDVVALARRLRPILGGVPLILNDRAHLVGPASADGLHIGQDDMPAAAARALIGTDRILGLSVREPDDAVTARTEPVDYLGCGHVFPTTSKAKATRPIGPDGLAAVCRAARHPVIAIGGIAAANVFRLGDAGAAGIAVISAITAAPDPEAAARLLRRALGEPCS